MPDIWMWGLISSFMLLAISTTLKAVESSHSLKLANEEIARLRKQNELIEEKNKNLTNEIGHFEKQILQKSQPKLSESHELTLIAVAIKSGSDVPAIANHMQKNIQDTSHALDYLVSLKYIEYLSSDVYIGPNDGYKTVHSLRLTELGHEYIKEHNLPV